ncbi:MAG TPA: SGNH/GDSL hydrolase family protein [Candidatus Limnocylindrales bacterium]|nr:SGNH/GDSL hydrolase family protein [Candidatus Limnocylindrales bacterium]
MRRAWAAAGAAILILAIAGPVAAENRSGEVATHYYLSLGDSLAAGVQPIGDPGNMYRTSDGYTDQLYSIAREHFPKLRHIKLGCPGETTATFVEGGICSYEYGTQLATALEFLHAHARFTSLITIDIGWNDVGSAEGCILGGGDPQACLGPGIASITNNLPTILTALRAAAPNVPIVAMNMYDPFLALWLAAPPGPQLATLSVGLLLGVNGLEEQIYGAFGVPVADVETAFHTTDFADLVPFDGFGLVPVNVVTICGFTWRCTAYADNHANHDGYHAIALAFAHELGWI